MAPVVRLLHQERWRPLPRSSRWQKVLGGFLGRYSTGVVVPECGDRDRWSKGLPPGDAEGLLYERWRRTHEAREKRDAHPHLPAGDDGRLARRLPQAAHPRL